MEKNSLFQIGIFDGLFKILHRLDLFPVDFQNDISFLKAHFVGKASLLNADDDHTVLDSRDSISSSELGRQFLNPCPQFFLHFLLFCRFRFIRHGGGVTSMVIAFPSLTMLSFTF